MKRWVIILLIALILIAFSVLYVIKYSRNILFEFDVVPNINESKTGKFSVPIKIKVQNKNKKGITVRDIDVTIIKDGKAIARSESPQDFNVDGNKTQSILHNFAIIDLKSVSSILLSEKTMVDVVVSFRFLFFPITLKFKQEI